MAKAESLARQYKFRKVSVIAGIGTKNYYRKLGYEQVETYMIKTLMDYKPLMFIGLLFLLWVIINLLNFFV